MLMSTQTRNPLARACAALLAAYVVVILFSSFSHAQTNVNGSGSNVVGMGATLSGTSTTAASSGNVAGPAGTNACVDGNGNVTTTGCSTSSGTVQSGSAYKIPAYGSAAAANVGPSNLTTDATGNNFAVPGVTTLGSTGQATVSAAGNISTSGSVAVGTTVLADGSLWGTGQKYLPRFRAKAGSLSQWSSLQTTTLNFACLGDSWCQNGSLRGAMMGMLQSQYGPAGYGYVAFDTASHSSQVIVTPTGTWTTCGIGSICYGVTASHMSTTDNTAALTVTLPVNTINSFVNTIVLHYACQPSGMSFDWNVDGGAWTTVATTNASLTYCTTSITGLSSGVAHTLNIQATPGASGTLTMMGADYQLTRYNGVRVHNLGHSGSQASDFANVPPAMMQAGLAALGIDTAEIVFGTNEENGNIDPATYAANLTALIDTVRGSTSPSPDVLLTPPADNGITGKTYTMSQYRTAMQGVALANNTAWYDTFAMMPPYATSNALGLTNGTYHLNGSGGAAYNGITTSALLGISPTIYGRSDPFNGYSIQEPGSNGGYYFTHIYNDGLASGGTTYIAPTDAHLKITLGAAGYYRNFDVMSLYANKGFHLAGNTGAFSIDGDLSSAGKVNSALGYQIGGSYGGTGQCLLSTGTGSQWAACPSSTGGVTIPTSAGGLCSDASSNLIACRLNKQDPQVSFTTGTASAQTVYTYTMPAATLSAGGCLMIESAMSKTGSDTLTATLSFGGTTVFTDAAYSTSGSQAAQKTIVCNSGASTASQWAQANGSHSGSNTGQQFYTSAIDTTAAVTITLTATVAATSTWEGRGFRVSLVP